MLEFEKSFFIGEEQSGYYVDSFSKRCKAAQLEILARVDDICKKYNIKYMMDGGTLLGAVRHGGFIPWDDDIDIMMERSDYNRFLEIIKTEMVDFTKNKNISYEALGGKLFYTNMYTDPYYDQIQTIIGNWHGIKMDDNFLQDYHGCPISQLIDVFPYDYWPEENDEILEEILKDYV